MLKLKHVFLIKIMRIRRRTEDGSGGTDGEQQKGCGREERGMQRNVGSACSELATALFAPSPASPGQPTSANSNGTGLNDKTLPRLTKNMNQQFNDDNHHY